MASLARLGREGRARQTSARLAEVIKEVTATHSNHDVQRLCRLSGLSRASYYRYVATDAEDSLDVDLQDAIQTICLRHKYYGYRRVTASLRRQGHVINAKKVLRLMREGNVLAMRRKLFLVPPQGKPESELATSQASPRMPGQSRMISCIMD